jgi:branched-chain amino acid transport system substrate-binding protein
MDRRQFLALMGASSISLTATRVSAQSTPSAGGTIKIGVPTPTTGSLASNGADVNTGIELFFKSIGSQAGGKTIELLFVDSAGEPQQALDQSRKLIGEDQVDFLVGIVNSSAAIPVAQLANDEQVPLIVAVAGGTPVITGPERSPYVFRTGITTSQQEPVLGWYTATTLEKKRATVFAWDFAAGDARAAAFTEAFTAAGGEVVSEQRPPVGTTDFGPFISQVNPGDIDVIYAYFAGPGAVSFVQQLRQFGFTPDVQVVGPGFLTEGEVLAAQGEDAEGIITATHYTPQIDNPENAAFLELYEKEHGSAPGTYVEAGWLAAQVAAHAIDAVGGDLSDTEAFLQAIAATELNSPSGPISFDDHGQVVRNLYMTRAEKGEGDEMTLAVVDVIEKVTQNWKPE